MRWFVCTILGLLIMAVLSGAALASSNAAAADDADALKPTLYGLLIGVTRDRSKVHDLAYPAKDALGLAEALKGQTGKLYKDVVVNVLTDADATSTSVKRGLDRLRRQMKARDLAVVFVAGPGLTDPTGRFWFLTADADPSRLVDTAVSQDDITGALSGLPGKTLLFLDVCHSAGDLAAESKDQSCRAIDSALNTFAQSTGAVVTYAASTGREASIEDGRWGHGAFAKALIEGFGGRADILHKGTITTATLDLFVENRVKELTDGRQHPVMLRPSTVPDFPIAIVR